MTIAEMRREEEIFLEKEILRESSTKVGNVAAKKSPCVDMQLTDKSMGRKRERVSRCKGKVGTDSLSRIGLKETTTTTDITFKDPKKARQASNYEDFIVEIPKNAKEGDILQVSLSPSTNQSIAFKVPPLGQEFEKITTTSTCPVTKRRIKVRIPKDFCRGGQKVSSSRRMSPKTMSSPSHKRRSGRVREVTKLTRIKEFDVAALNYNIGPSYQIPLADLPSANSHNIRDQFVGENYFEQIWDPNKGGASDCSSAEIDNLLANLPTNHKEIMMEALHKCKYDVDVAFVRYLERIRILKLSGDLPGEPLQKAEAELFTKSIFDQRKDLKEAISLTKKNGSKQSASSLLVHYYRNVKTSADYPRLKEMVAKIGSDCVVCNDGGTLICCDKCDDAYHLDCLDPPLKKVPEGSWFCPKCLSNAS